MTPVLLIALLLFTCQLCTEARRKITKENRCEKIEVAVCSKLGYARTKFPNPFTNITTQAATNNLTRFLPILFQLNCTRRNAIPFLCSVYVPRCSTKRPLSPPCREFCERSVGSCPALAARFGIIWPAPLMCSNYPSKNGEEKCFDGKLKTRRKNNKGKKGNGLQERMHGSYY